MSRSLAAFFCFMLINAPFASGQVKKANLTRKPVVPQSLVGGLWHTEGSFQSILMLKNVLEIAPLKVTPVLYMADGTEYILPAVDLDVSGVATVNINQALQDAPSQIQSHMSTFGSAGVRYSWSWPGAVLASVQSTDDVRSLTYITHLRVEMNKTQTASSVPPTQVLDGIWWKETPGIGGFLGLTNTSSRTVSAEVEVFDSQEKHASHSTFEIASHSTEMLDLGKNISQLPVSTTLGGIRISYAGLKNDIVADGGLQDEKKGYSIGILLTVKDPQPGPGLKLPSGTISYASPGVMIGSQNPEMQFPQSTQFIPYVILRNTASRNLSVALKATYLSGPTPVDVPLGNILLSSEEVRRLDVMALLEKSGHAGLNGYLNLETTFTGDVRNLLIASGSFDQTGTYVFAVNPVVEQKTTSKIICYWNTIGDTDTMVSLWNFSKQDEDLTLRLYHRQGHYDLPIHLNANASTIMNVATLIREQKPDASGNIIPSDVTEGSATLMGPHDSFDDIYVVTSASIFNVRTATCGPDCSTCTGVEEFFFDPDPSSIAKGLTQQFSVTVIMTSGTSSNAAPLSSWTSNNTSIATVSNSSPNVGRATAMTPGSTSLSFFFEDAPGGPPFCDGAYCEIAQIQGDPPVTVQIPTSASDTKAAKVTYTGNNVIECDGTNEGAGWGYSRCVTYQLLDQNTPAKPIEGGNYTAQETFTLVSANVPFTPHNQNNPLNADGVFLDFLGLTTTKSPGPTSGQFIIEMQSITILDNNTGTTYPIRKNCLNFQYNDVTLKDITAGGTCP